MKLLFSVLILLEHLTFFPVEPKAFKEQAIVWDVVLSNFKYLNLK